MVIATWMVALGLALFLVVLVGGIFLQIVLSKRENRYLGLILPGICLLNSLVPVLSLAAYDSAWQNFLAVVALLGMGNLPTLVLLAIYWGCREKLRKNRELEKMHLDDL